MAEPATPGRIFDAAVIGAGAAGLAAALALAREGFDTALVGRTEARADGRTIALLDGSVRFLRALGVWPALEARAAPLVTMRIVDDTGSLFRPPPATFQAAEIGLDAFGWNIENAELVAGLAEAARAEPRLRLFDEEATETKIGQDVAAVALSGGLSLAARLVVAADGRNSKLREAAGIRTRAWSYPQSALTTILAHERDHRDTSTEFHTRSGPFTLVPLPGRRSSLVWVTSRPYGERLIALDDDALSAAVERQAQSMLGRMRIDGPRALVPMSGLSVARFSAERLALIGEAAHVFPPIGAQGLNLGLRDAAALRDAAVDAHAAGEDIGGDAALARYQASRDLDVRLRTAAVDGLNRTLLSGFLPVDFLRGLGLIALSGIGPLRRAVMREGVLPAIGTPRLMRTGANESPARA
ncbi:MAG TPA: UbiH/UbiF family hydroxylase [Beijerinckiaceae bacterium]|jgi:2-octaprenyl-6-methoxyphenol hydroxylase